MNLRIRAVFRQLFFLQRYVDRVFISIERQALHMWKITVKRREDAARKFLNPIKDVPFWDWREL